MNFRRSALRAMSIRHDKGRFRSRPAAMAAGAAFALALLGGGAGNSLAAPVSIASAPDAASAAVAVVAGSRYTVHAGQSLNDVAIAITLSHDRAVLVRATRALFDTNPAAFMNHDPSRLRVGAVLIVPALDASGALAASSAGAAAGASESTVVTPASTSTAVPAAAAASTASAVAQVNAAVATAASAAAQTTTPAAPAVSGTASAPVAASAAVSIGAAAGGVVSSAPVAGSAPVATSGAQEWAGSIQPSASAPAGQAPSTATTAAPVASQPHPQVSSLQQLLALKNRVLMELQKHGIGGAPVASGPAPTSAAQPAAGGSAPTMAAAPARANVATSPSNEGGLSQRDLSIAAAAGAALVVLLAALRMGRRKREKEATARAAEASDADMARSASGPAAVTEGSDARNHEAAQQAAAAAERTAAEQAAAERAAAEQAAAEQAESERAAAEEKAAAERAAAEQEAARVAAERAEAERAEAERIAAERAAAEQEALQAGHPAQPDTPEPIAPTAPLADIPLSSASEPSTESPAVTPTHDETLRAAATAANLAAAAELGAEALPLGPLEPVTGETQDEHAHRLQWDDESTEGPTADEAADTTTTATPSSTETPSTEPHTATAEPQTLLNVPPPVIDFTQHQIEPHATASFGQPFSDIPAPPQAEPSAPTEFPRDAVDAFSSLNMPLPPRIEVPAISDAERSTSLSTQPGASPDTTAQQAFGAHDVDDDAPHIADQIAAGTAGHGAVAGLGAAGFGALKLDFDLELPPSPAQPLPAFTPADLARIARNKLELASEYIELGDLAGARALINEVIEANDPATRTEARALLSTLAPLS
ncbi:FimV/HubP family polar landmark protein [Paraburkholderia sp. HP33-1]|uniref:FimV/HubP family polar landmark protein n=1 Tax=Paraburkholderia sp. HP33-1 TaxID=2883243 RepID=UPI001F47BFD3|nr:FimV/HubP family polar landmark protein [Paraburkholderia sp. HP33-1]